MSAIFWQGSSSFTTGSTLFGYFDNDTQFQHDADKVAKWVARRLGYPIMDVEMVDYQMYDCFEQSVLEYSAQVNEFNMRENMINIQGMSTSDDLTQRLVKASPLPFIIEIAEDYGTEAGSGGDVDWKTGYITTINGQQEYDLQSMWADVSESGARIEIKRVFHDRTPAISRGGFGFGDAGSGPSDGTNNLLGEFGWAGYDGGLSSGASGGTVGQFLLMPLYETVLRTQAIEFNDMIRRSQYSFEIHNNKMKLMPRPQMEERVFFQYIVKAERYHNALAPSGSISDFSNAPYDNMVYSQINDVGKNWIRKMTLALAKETLGRVLSKYEQIPQPGAEIRLDGETLRREAADEKVVLYEQLRESLEEAGRSKQFEKMAQNDEHFKAVLKSVPFKIYIG